VTSQRSIHPVFILGAVALQKAAFFAAANSYGFHRIYRRLLEQNKYMVPKAHQKTTAAAIKLSFVAPTQILKIVSDNEYVMLILKNIATGQQEVLKYVPPFMVNMSKTLLDMAIRWNKPWFK
jgi:hypothetical protein